MNKQYCSSIFFGILAITISLIIASNQTITILAQYSIVEPQLPTLPSQHQQTRNATTAYNMTSTTSITPRGNEVTVAKDSVILFLEGKTIPANDFIPVYSTTHYVIISGRVTIIVHILAKLPCDTNSKSPIQLLLGRVPILKVIQPNLVTELSTSGKMCLYQLDVGSKPGVARNEAITDVVLKNPTARAITFPPSSAIIISMDEVRPSGRS